MVNNFRGKIAPKLHLTHGQHQIGSGNTCCISKISGRYYYSQKDNKETEHDWQELKQNCCDLCVIGIFHRYKCPSTLCDPSGDVGVGTASPSASLHIFRDNGFASILVAEETGTVGNRTMFKAINNGNVKIELNNTEAGERWRFENAGWGFKINNFANAGIEFSITNAGNATLAGILTENSDVNSKQDIESVDIQNILSKISQLDIAEWSYKDTPKVRHIGPMAQDFYAAFGLGQNEKFIATLDSAGIALAGIQALMKENNRLGSQNQAILEQLDIQKNQFADLEAQQVQLQELIAGLLGNNFYQTNVAQAVLK